MASYARLAFELISVPFWPLSSGDDPGSEARKEAAVGLGGSRGASTNETTLEDQRLEISPFKGSTMFHPQLCLKDRTVGHDVHDPLIGWGPHTSTRQNVHHQPLGFLREHSTQWKALALVKEGKQPSRL